jgi:hypothetical protein
MPRATSCKFVHTGGWIILPTMNVPVVEQVENRKHFKEITATRNQLDDVQDDLEIVQETSLKQGAIYRILTNKNR